MRRFDVTQWFLLPCLAQKPACELVNRHLKGCVIHTMQSRVLMNAAQCTCSHLVCCMHRLDTAAFVRAPGALLSSCSESCGQLQRMLATQGQWHGILAESQQTASHLARAAVHLQEQATALRYDVQTGVCPSATSKPARLPIITQSRLDHACLENTPSQQLLKHAHRLKLHHAPFSCGRAEPLPILAGAIGSRPS